VELDNVDVRLVRAERDTGLEDVAPGTVDRVLITDSLMFEHGRDRHEDVAYLRSLGELLRKEGELLYHIDWVEVGRHLDREEIIALFRDAGFSATVREIPKPKHIPETATLYHSAGDKIIRLPLKRGFILLFHRD